MSDAISPAASRPLPDAIFRGCGTALVTPFKADLGIDEEALRRLVNRQIEDGIHFLVPCGTTGENPTLSRRELLRVIEIVLEEANGEVPVLAGCGGNDTREVAHLAKEIEALGAQGLLSATPAYNRPTPEGLVEHYKAIAKASKLPIVLYNVPSRTGTNMDAKVTARLAEIDTVVAVKEASGNLSQVAAILQEAPDGFTVLSGDDALTLPVMSLGGVGVISVASNEVPAGMARMAALCLAGDFAAAREVHRRLHDLMEVNFIESNPGPVKTALAIMGHLEPIFRLPMVPPRPESRKKIEKVLLGLGLIAQEAPAIEAVR
ncbi:MAG TPA: 4-hydroxy-tetrahydrodipicolinate synthase [Thermoanaerobaculia bacterium]|nr:4-hydroxy-tetrahydrodipicolinate synthase [Thermoanaerobaculia bacterium]